MYSLRFRGELPAIVAKEFDSFLTTLKAWIAVDHNEDGTHNLRPSGFDFVPIGAGMEWYSDTAPERWIFARGQVLSRSTYAALFQLWGTTYGIGDGSTTFGAPNLERRVAIGKAASGSASTLGATGGDFDHTHSFTGGTTGANGGFSTSTSAGGAHDHGNTGLPSSNVGIATAAGGTFFSLENHVHATASVADHDHSVTVGDHTHSFGGGATAGGNQAYLVVNYIVLAGV